MALQHHRTALLTTLMVLLSITTVAAAPFDQSLQDDTYWDTVFQDLTDTMADLETELTVFTADEAADDAAASATESADATDQRTDDTTAAESTAADEEAGTASSPDYNDKLTPELQDLLDQHGTDSEYDTFITVRDGADLQQVADQVEARGGELNGVHDNVNIVSAWVTPSELAAITELDTVTEVDMARTEYECHDAPCNPPEPVR